MWEGVRQADNTMRPTHLEENAPERDMGIGKKVVVTRNVETDSDITNGTRATIVGLLLHPDEPPITWV